jgi:hypothetical protein
MSPDTLVVWEDSDNISQTHRHIKKNKQKTNPCIFFLTYFLFLLKINGNYNYAITITFIADTIPQSFEYNEYDHQYF